MIGEQRQFSISGSEAQESTAVRVEILITCGGCGEAIPIAEAHVLPGNPPEARCARCIGEEAPRG